MSACLRIALTPGEPAGIGPDLCLLLAQQAQAHQLVAVADPELLEQRASELGLDIQLREYDPAARTAPTPQTAATLDVAPIKLAQAVTSGQLNVANAPYVLACLDKAVELVQNNHCAALVTGPVHKGIINEAGISFSGHTEYLAAATGTQRVVMMLATEGLRVALATTHLPLAEVSKAITKTELSRTLHILHGALVRQFGIREPRILVCGLNPHAGEGGHLGREEIEIITPVLDRLRAEGMRLEGPLPADTLFTPPKLDNADAVLAMYHDQGLPVLKYKGFGRAVNITLGLPIVRTSVDHGTALDLAGTGKVDVGSLRQALASAVELGLAQRNRT